MLFFHNTKNMRIVRTLLIFAVFTAALAIQEAPQRLQRKQFSKDSYIYKADKVVYDLADYITLDSFDRAEATEDCQAGVTFSDPINGQKTIVTPYSKSSSYTGCTKVEAISERSLFHVICNEKTLIFVDPRYGDGTLTAEPASVDLIEAGKIHKITKCTGMEVRQGGKRLFVSCNAESNKKVVLAFKFTTPTKTKNLPPPIKPEVSKLAQQPQEFTLTPAKYELEDSIAFEPQEGKTTSETLTIDVYESDKESNTLNVYMRDASVSTGFKAFYTEYNINDDTKKGAFNQGLKKFVTETDINNFPTTEIKKVDSHSGVMVVTYLDSGKTSVNIKVCAMFSNDRKCGAETFVYMPQDSTNYMVVSKLDENNVDLNILAFGQTFIEYRAYRLDEDLTLKEEDIQKKKPYVYTFDHKTDIEVSLGAEIFGNRVFLYGTDNQGLPKATLIWMDKKNKYNINLSTIQEKNGRFMVRRDLFMSDEEDLYYFGSEKLTFINLLDPQITFSDPIENKETDPEITVSCSIKLFFKGGVTDAMDIKYRVMREPKSGVKIELPKYMGQYTESKFYLPIYSQSYSGNAPAFSSAKVGLDDSKVQFLYANKVTHNMELKVKEAEKINGSDDPLIDYKSIWVGGKNYIVQQPEGYMLFNCNAKHDDLTLPCTKMAQFNANDFNVDHKLLETVLAIKYIYFFFDIRTAGALDNGKGKATRLVVFDLKEKKVTYAEEFVDYFDDVAIQHYNGYIYFYGVRRSLDVFQDISFAKFKVKASYTANEIKFEQADQIGKKICPVNISFFPHSVHALMILSYCQNEDMSVIYQIKIDRESPSTLEHLDSFNVGVYGFKSPGVCVTAGHIHVVERDPNVNTKIMTFDADVSEDSVYNYPLQEFESIKQFQDMSCDQFKDSFYVLATGFPPSTNQMLRQSGTKSYLIAIRGTSQDNPSKRFHSITEVDSTYNRISAGYCPFEDQSLVMLSQTTVMGKIGFYLFQPFAPKFFIDASAHKGIEAAGVTLTMSSDGEKKYENKSDTVIKFVRFNSQGTITPRQCKNEIKAKDNGDSFEVNIDEAMKISGPVSKIVYSGPTAAATVTERLTSRPDLELLDENPTGFRISPDGKYALVWGETKYAFYKDKKAVVSSSGKVISGSIIYHDALTEPVAIIVVESEQDTKIYMIYQSKGETTWNTIISDKSIEKYEDNITFTPLNEFAANFISFSLVSTNNFLTPQIDYMTMTINETKKNARFLHIEQDPYRHTFKQKIHSTEILKVGFGTLTISMVGSYKGLFFSLAREVLSEDFIGFKEIKNEIIQIVDKETDSFYHLNHETSRMSCSTIVDKTEGSIVRCLFISEGMFSYVAEIKLNDIELLREDPSKPLIIQNQISQVKVFSHLSDYKPIWTSLTSDIGIVVFTKNTPIKTSLAQAPSAGVDFTKENNIVVIYDTSLDIESDSPYAFIPGSSLELGGPYDGKKIFGFASKESGSRILTFTSKDNVLKRHELSSFILSGKSLANLQISSSSLLIYGLTPTPQTIPFSSLFGSAGSAPSPPGGDGASEQARVQAEQKRQENEVSRTAAEARRKELEDRLKVLEDEVKKVRDEARKEIELMQKTRKEIESGSSKKDDAGNNTNKKDTNNEGSSIPWWLYPIIAGALILVIIVGVAVYYLMTREKLVYDDAHKEDVGTVDLDGEGSTSYSQI